MAVSIQVLGIRDLIVSWLSLCQVRLHSPFGPDRIIMLVML